MRYRTKQLNSARRSEKHRKDDRDTVSIYFSSAWFLNPVRCQLRIIKHGEGSINAMSFVGKSVTQRSPIFWAPETSFVADDFPQDGWFLDDSSSLLYTYGFWMMLKLMIQHQLHLRSLSIRSPKLGNPCCNILLFHVSLKSLDDLSKRAGDLFLFLSFQRICASLYILQWHQFHPSFCRY